METRTTSGPGPVDTSASPHARWRTLPLRAVRLSDRFWKPRQELNHDVSLPNGYRMLEQAGNLHDLRLAAGQATGPYRGPVYMDSDVYKWLEAVAYELARRPDPALETAGRSVIELIAAAQGEDGYLNSYWQIVEPHRRWEDLSHGHELYCAGHLIQAAVAFQRATGQTELLAVARRFADYIDSVFGPGRRAGTPGHPEIEMALVELYRESGDARYLNLARFFIDQRGRGLLGPGGHGGPAYYQDHQPVREARTIEGHAVRALYLASGVADLYLETGEGALWSTLESQWQDMTRRKMYVTGGLGSRHLGEAFGEPYELPNDRAYCETCAAIGSVMWNWRMLLATGDGRFADVLERTLYNGVLAGISLDGRHYFYVNPLLSHGVDSLLGRKTAVRAEWHSCACCPPNVMRLLASLSHYVATRNQQGVQIHLYATADLAIPLDSERTIRLAMVTDYPWQGNVQIRVIDSPPEPWSLELRLPGWSGTSTLRVNGHQLDQPDVCRGYVVVDRQWQHGDVVELELDLAPRLTEAHPLVDPDRASVAIERGPIVYCLEQPDQEPGVDVLGVEIDSTSPLVSRWRPDLLGGVVAVEANGSALDLSPWDQSLYLPAGTTRQLDRRPIRLTAIPYYAWANRGPARMRVWIPRILTS